MAEKNDFAPQAADGFAWPEVTMDDVRRYLEAEGIERDPYSAAADEWNRANPDKAPITGQTIRDKDRGGFWGGLRLLVEGIGDAVTDQFLEDLGRAWRGGDVTPETRGWADEMIARQQRDRAARIPSRQEVEGDWVAKSLYNGPQSVATSLATGLGGMGLGAAAGAAAGPAGSLVGGMVGAGALSGAAFYRMAKDSFVEEVRDRAVEVLGRDLSQEEAVTLNAAIDEDATNFGLWEAGPEAISQFFTAGLLGGAGGAVLKRIGLGSLAEAVGGRAVTRVGAKVAAEVAEEEATELATYFGQEKLRQQYGLRPDAPSLKEFGEEQAGAVLVGAGLQMGGMAAGRHAWNRYRARRQADALERELDAAADAASNTGNTAGGDNGTGGTGGTDAASGPGGGDAGDFDGLLRGPEWDAPPVRMDRDVWNREARARGWNHLVDEGDGGNGSGLRLTAALDSGETVDLLGGGEHPHGRGEGGERGEKSLLHDSSTRETPPQAGTATVPPADGNTVAGAPGAVNAAAQAPSASPMPPVSVSAGQQPAMREEPVLPTQAQLTATQEAPRADTTVMAQGLGLPAPEALPAEAAPPAQALPQALPAQQPAIPAATTAAIPAASPAMPPVQASAAAPVPQGAAIPAEAVAMRPAQAGAEALTAAQPVQETAHEAASPAAEPVREVPMSRADMLKRLPEGLRAEARRLPNGRIREMLDMVEAAREAEAQNALTDGAAGVSSAEISLEQGAAARPQTEETGHERHDDEAGRDAAGAGRDKGDAGTAAERASGDAAGTAGGSAGRSDRGHAAMEGERGTAVVRIPNRASEAVTYEILETGGVRASHLPEAGFQKTPGYALENERRYHDEPASQRKVQENAANLDPAFLLESVDANHGAPVIDRQGNVLGGNGRAMSVRLAYEKFPQRAAAYREALRGAARRLGLDPARVDGMERPVLVRRLERDLGPEERQELVSALNDTFTDSKDRRASGKSRGDRLSRKTLEALASGMAEADTLRQYFDDPASAGVVDLLIQDGVIQKTERNAYVGADGLLNPDGKRVVEEALRGRVARSYETLAALPGPVLAKIDAAIPHLLIAEGVGRAWDITHHMRDAIDLMAEFRASGEKVPETFLGRVDMLKGSAPSERYSKAAQALFLNLNRLRKAEYVRDFAAYAGQAKISPEAGGMPGAGMTQERAAREFLGIEPETGKEERKAAAKAAPAEPPAKGADPFGPAYAAFSGKPAEAIEHLLKVRQGHVPAAFHKEGLGDIDLPWGKGGSKGNGLAHIIERRNKEGLDGIAFVRSLPEIIERGDVEHREGYPGRAYIVDGKSEAVIRLDWDGEKRAWLVTAYPDKSVFEPPSSGRGSRSTRTAAFEKTPSKDLGAVETSIPPAKSEGKADGSYGTADAPDTVALAGHFADAFLDGRKFGAIVEARREAARLLGGPVRPATETAKAVDEAIELGVTLAARRMIADMRQRRASDADIYRALVDLYQRQPRLGVRTSTSVAQQAYSTPAPLAFLVSRLAGVNGQTRVFEPTAGNGMLLLEASPDRAVVNELNPDRSARLRSQGFEVTERDAAGFAPERPVEAVLANPPFGRVRDGDGQTREFSVDGLTTKELDHAIVARALGALEDGGRAALIIGGRQGNEASRARKYRSADQVNFWNWLFSRYRVLDHFSVDGKLYERQGAGYPVDVIVLENSGPSEGRPFPGAALPRVYDTFDSLEEVLHGPVVDAAERQSGADSGVAGRLGKRRDRGSGSADLAGRHDVADADRGSGRGGGDAAHDGARSGKRLDGGLRDNRHGGAVPGRVRGGLEPAGQHPGNEGTPDTPDRGKGQGRGDMAAEGHTQGAGQRGGRDDAGRVDLRGDGGDVRPGMGVGPRKQTKKAAAVRPKATEFQVPYEGASALPGMGTLVPRNMATAVKRALAGLEQRHGGIDRYVADQLGYPVEELGDYFAAEQVDALGMAISNIAEGSGFIIGDQTGIGKGRVNAAIIRWAKRQGHTPVFITMKPDLYADMVRDLADIGMEGFNPLPTNAGMSGDSAILLPDGRTLRTKSAKAHEKTLARVLDDGLGEYDAVFTTYDQLNTVKGKEPFRRSFLMGIAPNAVFILDESHNAGGQSGKRARASDADDRAQFTRRLLQASRQGAFYSSATYAKRPDVMSLYFKTDMRYAAEDMGKLAEAIERGGIPLQQVVAASLTETGQYLRRERSFEGADLRTSTVPIDKGRAEKTAEIMRAIMAFDKAKEAAVRKADKEAAKTGGAAGNNQSTGKGGASSTNFTAVMHNVIAQSLLAQKIDAVVESASGIVARGEKVVIALANTMGSMIKEHAAKHGIAAGQPINLTFNDMFARYLEKTREITISHPWEKDKEKKKTTRRLTDGELGPEGVKAYNEALEVIKASDFGGLQVSVIDRLLAEFAARGIRADEITGRTARIDYTTDEPTYATRKSGASDRIQVVDAFNSGKLDVVILNQSGSTGISLHASERFADQKRRTMIIAQAESNIDVFMQTLGRVFRTGQVVPPAYEFIMSDLPAEKRPAAVLAKKMASLNANTTASRDSDTSFKNIPDFLNKCGDAVAAQVMADNPELSHMLGDPVEDGGDEAMRKVTGRIPLLPVKEQERLYALLEQEYDEYVAQLEAMGGSGLEARSLPLDARLLDEAEIVPAGEADKATPFAAAALLGTYDVKKLGKPWPSAKVREMVAAASTPDIGAIWNEALAWHGKKAKKMSQEAAEKQLDRLHDCRRALERAALLRPGTPVFIDGNNTLKEGVLIGIQRKGGADNPLALGSWKMEIALPDASRKITIPLSQTTRAENPITVRESHRRQDVLYGMFDSGQLESREKVHIITGNILAAYQKINGKGQVITFQDNEGNTRPGILLPRDADPRKLVEDMDVSLSPETALRFLRELPGKSAVKTADKLLVMSYDGTDFTVSVPASKARGAQFFLNGAVLEAAGRDFVKSGQSMTLRHISGEQALGVLRALSSQGYGFVADNNKDVARGMAAEGPRASLASAAGGERRAYPYNGREVGSITPEIAARLHLDKPGPIVLDDTGLRHIEERHGEQIRGLGFADARSFVRFVLAQVDAVYDVDGKGRKYDVVTRAMTPMGRVMVRLEFAEEGDFYSVATAGPLRKNQYANKKPLWEGAHSTRFPEETPWATRRASQRGQSGDSRQSAANGPTVEASGGGVNLAAGRFLPQREAGARPLPASREALRRVVDKLNARAANGADVRLADTMGDLPAHLRKAFDGKAVEGVYDPETGTVWLVADQLGDPQRAAEVWAHETLAHHGLRALFNAGERKLLLNQLWLQMGGMGHPLIAETARRYGIDPRGDVEGRLTVMEEALAKLAERRAKGLLNAPDKAPEQSLWRRVVAAVLRAWQGLVKRLTGREGSMDAAGMERLLDSLQGYVMDGRPVEGAARTQDGNAVKENAGEAPTASLDSDRKAAAHAAWRQLQRDTEQWARQVENFEKSTQPRKLLEVCRTPDVLLKLKEPDVPMVMTAGNLAKILSDKVDHQLPKSLVAQLPAALAEPVMIFESATVSDTLVVLTDLTHEGRPVMVAIHPDVERQRIQVHDITSAYKRAREWFLRQMEAGRLLYQDKKKSLAWARTNGLQLPKVRKLPAKLENRLLTEADIVKPEPPAKERPLASLHSAPGGDAREQAAAVARRLRAIAGRGVSEDVEELLRDPEQGRLIPREDLGKLERLCKLPHWIAKDHPKFAAIYNRQLRRVDERRAALLDATSRVPLLFDGDAKARLNAAEERQLGEMIWKWDGKEIGALQGIEKFLTTGTTLNGRRELELNPRYQEKFREWLDTQPEPPRVREAFAQVRAVLDDAFLKAYRRMAGMADLADTDLELFRTEMGNQPNYFPHQRKGKYFVQATEGAGTPDDPRTVVFRQHFDVPLGSSVREEWAKIVSANRVAHPGATWSRPREVTRLPDDILGAPIDPQAMEQLITAAVNRQVKDADQAEDVRKALLSGVSDILKARGFGAHGIRRQGIPGFEKEDVKGVLYTYLSGLNGWLSKMDASADFAKALGQIDASRSPDLWGYASQYVHDMLRNTDSIDRIAGNIKTLAFAWYLGGNLKTAAVNATQNFIVGVPRLQQEVSGGGALWLRAAMDTLGLRFSGRGLSGGGVKKLTPDEARMLEDLYGAGVIADAHMDEIRGQMARSPALRAWERFVRVLGMPMSIVEHYNRASLALAAYRAARAGRLSGKACRRLGVNAGERLSHDAARDFADTLVRDAHFEYGRGNAPELLRGTAVGRMISPAFVFRSFTGNILNLWWRALWHEGREGRVFVAKSLGATVALGGLTAFPFYATLSALCTALSGDDEDWTTHVRRALPESDLLRDVVCYGLPSLGGVSLGGSLRMETPFTGGLEKRLEKGASFQDAMTESIVSLIGIPYDLAVVKPSKALEAQKHGAWDRALEALVPTFAANLMAAYRLGTEGQTTLRGRPINTPGEKGARHLSGYEAGAKALGFQPTSSTKSYAAWRAGSLRDAVRGGHIDDFTVQALEDLEERGRPYMMRELRRRLTAWNAAREAEGKPGMKIMPKDVLRRVASRRRENRPTPAQRAKGAAQKALWGV